MGNIYRPLLFSGRKDHGFHAVIIGFSKILPINVFLFVLAQKRDHQDQEKEEIRYCRRGSKSPRAKEDVILVHRDIVKRIPIYLRDPVIVFVIQAEEIHEMILHLVLFHPEIDHVSPDDIGVAGIDHGLCLLIQRKNKSRSGGNQVDQFVFGKDLQRIAHFRGHIRGQHTIGLLLGKGQRHAVGRHIESIRILLIRFIDHGRHAVPQLFKRPVAVSGTSEGKPSQSRIRQIFFPVRAIDHKVIRTDDVVHICDKILLHQIRILLHQPCRILQFVDDVIIIVFLESFQLSVAGVDPFKQRLHGSVASRIGLIQADQRAPVQGSAKYHDRGNDHVAKRDTADPLRQIVLLLIQG